MVDRQHRKDDRQKCDRHEEQRFDRLVGGAVQARLFEAAEDVDQRLVDAEVDDREHERQGEGQAFPEPLPQQRGLQAPTDHCDSLGRQDHGEIDAAERVLDRVRPYEISDSLPSSDAIDHQGEEDQAFEDDGDSLITELLHGVEAVAQQRRVRGQDHQDETRQQQGAKTNGNDQRGEQEESDDRHEQSQRHDVAHVALDLFVMARPLAHEEDVETEVEHHACDRCEVDKD